MKKCWKQVLLFVMVTVAAICIGRTETKAATIVETRSCGDSATFTLDSDGVLTISGSGAIWDNAFYNDNDIKEKVLSNDSTKKKTAKRFVPPTIDEVRAYCSERGNFVDPESFISFYESNGWKVGRNTMVDWKAAVRTWEHRDSRAAPTDKYAEIDRQFLERYKDDTE